MKILLTAKIPHHTFNAAVRDGTAGAKLKKILEAIKPEAVYFTEFCGQRTAVVIVDLPDASKIPALAEPWFLTFEADVQIHPVMTPEESPAGRSRPTRQAVELISPTMGYALYRRFLPKRREKSALPD